MKPTLCKHSPFPCRRRSRLTPSRRRAAIDPVCNAVHFSSDGLRINIPVAIVNTGFEQATLVAFGATQRHARAILALEFFQQIAVLAVIGRHVPWPAKEAGLAHYFSIRCGGVA